MNFSKLFLMVTLGVSLNNAVCGMEQNDNKKRKRDDENTQQSKKNKKEYDEAATQELKTFLNILFTKVSEEKIKGLLNAGANPNIQGNCGFTPLHCAARRGYKDVVEMLIKRGADLKIQDNSGWTPLHWAANKGHKEIVELLLNAGADLNIQDNDGSTPLHKAAFYGYKGIVEMLLKHGANPNIQDNDGSTPLHKAALGRNKKVVESIINFIKDGAPISDDKVTQLTYLCSIDKIFRKKCEIFLMINKRKPGLFKIPKLLCYEFLLQLWDPTQFITELVNAKKNQEKTALDLARERGNEGIVTLLEPYEKKEVNQSTSFCILN